MNHRSRPNNVPCLAIACLLAGAPLVAEEAPPSRTTARLFALELGVPDVDRATRFYTEALGFEVLREDASGAWTLLANGEARLALAASEAPAAPATSARTYPNFTVGDLEAAGGAVVAAGGAVGEPFETPVGRAATYTDPFGHRGNLIDHPWDDETRDPDAAPEVFNVALNVRSTEDTEAFYAALGFAVRTRDYLPQTLVFEPLGTAQIILHPYAETPATDAVAAGALLLDADPGRALEALAALDPAIPRAVPASLPVPGAAVEVRDPSGIPLKLAQQAPGAAPRPRRAGLSAEEAAAAFERLKGLAGEWRAKSSRGWDEPVLYEVVADGSVVVERNSFADAPEKTMYTLFHLDGDRLLATHYCVSGTQPRLVATAVADDGRQVTFTYLDGTGLPSRDHGHMDQAVFRFLDEDRFTSRWTWYEKGSEQWLEEIEHRRTGEPTVAASP